MLSFFPVSIGEGPSGRSADKQIRSVRNVPREFANARRTVRPMNVELSSPPKNSSSNPRSRPPPLPADHILFLDALLLFEA